MGTDGIHPVCKSGWSGFVPPDQTEFLNVYKVLSEARAKEMDRFNPSARGADREYQGESELRPISALILMSVLYAARVASLHVSHMKIIHVIVSIFNCGAE
jgi:hypothetical protein